MFKVISIFSDFTDVSSFHLQKAGGIVLKFLLPTNSKSYYYHLLDVSSSYSQWLAAATSLDTLDGKDAWKEEEECLYYDYKAIRKTLTSLKDYRDNNPEKLLLLLRTCLYRDFADINNPLLYSHTRVGTKDLIKDYNAELIECFKAICSDPRFFRVPRERISFFEDVRKAFGRTALMLSGGGCLALHHVGVVKSLWENKLLPRIISGASGGSIIAGFACTRTEDQYSALFFPEFGELKFFNEADFKMINLLKNLKKDGVLFSIDTLALTLQEIFGNMTFAESYNKTRKILNVSVTSSNVFDMPSLLNFVTAPNVVIWSAIEVSCSVPLIFKPAQLLAKRKDGNLVPWSSADHSWIDGSVKSDLPMKIISEQFNVNHFIVSQVNPHVVPFLTNQIAKSWVYSSCQRVLNFCTDEIAMRCDQLSTLGILPSSLHKLKSIISQKYAGDITLMPDYQVSDYLAIFSNPTPEKFLMSMQRSEKIAWPKISYIKNMLEVELALDESLYKARGAEFESKNKPTNSILRKQSAGDVFLYTKRAKSLPRSQKNFKSVDEMSTLI